MAGMQPLTAVIANEFAEPAYRADLATIVGTRSDDALAAWIGELCRAHLGSDVAGARFAGKSVGAVFGLVLADGAAVVLKLLPPTFAGSELRAIERCVAQLVAVGFPMPRPLGPLFPAGAGWAGFSELVDGSVLDAHEPAVRCTLAELLAELARLALDPRDLPIAATRRTTLWAAPHRLGLDYARPGGAWIDARAEAAQQIARAAALREIAAHSDWGTKNALFRDGRLCAILDWDSLECASEAEMVGRAAAEFTAQWEFPAALAPTREEATAFVREYEAARGRALTANERAVANAAADYLVAQIARQELGADGEYQRLLRATQDAPLIAF
jgi:hypothetical protein